MKKIFTALYVSFLLLMLIGCAAPLHGAAEKGDIGTVKTLLDKGAIVDSRGDHGETALDWAAGSGHNDVVKLLLERGADVNAVHSGGFLGGIWNYPYWTPLASAAYHGHTDTVNLLLDKGADIDLALLALDKNGTSGAKSGAMLLTRIGQKRATRQLTPARPSKEVASSPAAIKSDIDELPAIKTKPNSNAYAIVIGVEKYRQNLPNADFAAADAQTVKEYLTKIMGYPEENVISLTNEYAAKSDFEKYFEQWLPNNFESDSTVFVYYSGHGAPNPRTGDAYLVPYDGDPSFIDQTGYSLKRMYDALGKLPAKEIIVALDSCFSGAGGRSVLAAGARPLVMNLQISVALPKNITVIAAAAGDQISSTYKDKGHGLFTYFLLKGIRNEGTVNPDGSLEISDLFSYIKPRVQRIARKKYNSEQTPQLIVSDNL